MASPLQYLEFMNTLRAVAAVALLSLSSFATIGCDHATDDSVDVANQGGVEIIASTSSALTLDQVTRVIIDVNGNGNSPQVRTFELTRSGAGWFGRIGELPAGSYRFGARAVDASGNALFIGIANDVIVTPGIDAAVNLNMRQVAFDPPLMNRAPFIGMLSATKRVVAPGETITLRAVATDDDNDPLSFAWTANRGAIPAPYANEIRWTAPMDPGPVEVTASVDDAHGATSVARIILEVGAANGGASVITTFFEAPRVLSIGVSNGQPQLGEMVRVEAIIDSRATGCGPYPYGPQCTMQLQWTSDCGPTATTGQYGFAGGPASNMVNINQSVPSCQVTVHVFEPISGAVHSGTIVLHPVQSQVTYEMN